MKERGEYDSRQEADRAARVVLALLGAHLVGEVRAHLAATLPEDFALILLNRCKVPNRCHRSGSCGRRGLDRRATEQTAAWDVSAVLSTVADAAGEDLLHQILLQL
ncbi:hypothetical protein BLA24_10660, partial [Streptomyces cinnamoneus]